MPHFCTYEISNGEQTLSKMYNNALISTILNSGFTKAGKLEREVGGGKFLLQCCVKN